MLYHFTFILHLSTNFLNEYLSYLWTWNTLALNPRAASIEILSHAGGGCLESLSTNDLEDVLFLIFAGGISQPTGTLWFCKNNEKVKGRNLRKK